METHDLDIAPYWLYAQHCAERAHKNPLTFMLACRQLYVLITQNLPLNFSADDKAKEYIKLSALFKKYTLKKSVLTNIIDLSIACNDSVHFYQTASEQEECFIGCTAVSDFLLNACNHDPKNVTELYRSINKPKQKSMTAVSAYIQTTQNTQSLYSNWKTCSARRFKLRSLSTMIMDRKILEYSNLSQKPGQWDIKLKKNLLLKQSLSHWVKRKKNQKHINKDSRLTSALTLLNKLNIETKSLEKHCYNSTDRAQITQHTCSAAAFFMVTGTIASALHHMTMGISTIALAAGKSFFAGTVTSLVYQGGCRLFKKSKSTSDNNHQQSDALLKNQFE